MRVVRRVDLARGLLAHGLPGARAGGLPGQGTWQAMGEQAASQIDPPDDTHGTSEYRRRLTATLVSRALAEAGERGRDRT